jgi:hypothetical protein
MALNTSIKLNPSNPNSQPPARPGVKVNPMSTTTARANALKSRLTGQTANPLQPGAGAQPAAPRPVGSTARAVEQAALRKYATPQAAPQAQPMSNVEPPPSGDPNVRSGATSVPESQGAPATTVTGTPPPAAVATGSQADPQLAALARRERSIRRAQEALAADKAAFQQERERMVPKDRISSDTLKVLAEAGVTYDRLVELQVAQANPDPNAQLQEQLSTALNKIQQLETQFNSKLEERDSLQEQQALTQIGADAQLLVDSDPAYETIKATNSVPEITKLIHRVFKEEGQFLDVAEAAQIIEEKLVEREYDRYQTLSKLQKIRARLAPPPSAAPEGAGTAEASTPQQGELSAQQQAPKQATRTLTNAGTVPPARQLTARERAIERVKEMQMRQLSKQ